MATRLNTAAWCLSLLVAGCSGPRPNAAPQPGTEADRQAISRVREQEIATLISGDVEKHLALGTDDMVLMPPNEPAVVGKEALGARLRSLLQQFRIEGNTSGAELRVIGDWAFERMSAKLKLTPIGGGAAIEDVWKGLHVYRREADGSWKIAYDIWSSDMPIPTPK
jgi:ketosteroid isomerase-like protein